MSARSLALSVVVVASLTTLALPAHADVTGGCDGQAVIDGVTYTPANDSADNPIVIPDEAGAVVPVQGSAPFDNNGHRGEMLLHLGPATVQLAEWEDDNGELPNQNSSSDAYALDDLLDELPFDARGLYRVSGTHTADGGSCEGFVMFQFGGPSFESPVTQAAAAVGVGSLALLVIAALAVASLAPGLVRGRRWLGMLAGLLFGAATAVLLQQTSVWPLDNLTAIGLPLLAAVLGFLLASWAPLGRGRLAAAPSPADPDRAQDG